MKQLVKLPNTTEERVETGPVQFGDDWPGVFIRGDNANYYGFTLQQATEALKKGDMELAKYYLIGPLTGIGEQLSELLMSCDVRRLRGENPDANNDIS